MRPSFHASGAVALVDIQHSTLNHHEFLTQTDKTLTEESASAQFIGV
jgi:hypothetical protein